MSVWPSLVDMTRDESTRILRRLELEAYSTIVDVFRAQGFLTKDKKSLLGELQSILSISTERHRAEVRRAVNDEHLATIADYLVGPNNDAEWLHEGRRLVPLMPRLVPQTQFTPLANHVASLQGERNLGLPMPSQTGHIKETPIVSASQISTQTPPPPIKSELVSSPSSNVVVLPSGKSIHIKGGINIDEEGPIKKRRKRMSGDMSQIHMTTRPLLSPPISRVSYATASTNTTYGVSPMKITITKTAITKTPTNAISGHTQKVILVSSAGSISSPNVIHKPTFPLVKNIPASSVTTTYVTRTPAQAIAANRPPSHMAPGVGMPTTWGQGLSSNVYANPIISGPRPRTKTIIRHRAPQMMQGGIKPGVVMSMGPQAPTPVTPHNVQVRPMIDKTTITPRPGMRMYTPTGIAKNAAPTTTRLVPRSPVFSGGSVVVVGETTQSQSHHDVTTTVASSKILSITNQGGKVIATSSKGSNVVTVNPKTLHLTAVKSSTGSKPNVIVVQKAGAKKLSSTSGATATVITKPGGMPSTDFEKELVSFIQKQEPRGVIVTTTMQSDGSGKPMPVVQIQRSRSDSDQFTGKNTSLLAELIQAAAMESGSPAVVHQTQPEKKYVHKTVKAVRPRTFASSSEDAAAMRALVDMRHLCVHPFKAVRPRQTQYQRTFASSSEDAAAIRALVDMQNQGKDSSQDTGIDAAVDSLYSIEQTLKAITAQQQTTYKSYPVSQPRKYTQNVSLLSKQQTSSSSQFIPELIEPTQPTPVYISEPNRPTTVYISEPSRPTSVYMSEQSRPTSVYMPESSRPTSVYMPESSRPTTVYISESSRPTTVYISEPNQSTPVYLTQTTQSTPVYLTQTSLPTSVYASPKPTPPAPTGAKDMDLLRESLASAQIDLDPYEFIDEEENSGVVVQVQEAPQMLPTSSESVDELDMHMTQPQGAVAVVRSDVDTGVMNLEDFSSQRLFTSPDFCDVIAASEEVTDMGPYPSTDEGADALTDSPTHRASKRKRKAPSLFDDEFGEMSSWVRPALTLLNKVCHFRGNNRDKDDPDASHWFLQPVDPTIAPDYDKIVKTPMDFSRIRRKLEMNQYNSPDDFHSDMLLVYRNCLHYNPPGHAARQDCEELFGFYVDEYTRLLSRLTKPNTSPVYKRVKSDKSPTKL